MTRRLITALLILLLLPATIMAQQSNNKRPSRQDRETWMKEMQQYKTDYIVKTLKLTEEQKAKFVPVYNQMDNEVRHVNEQAMKLEREVRRKGNAATDLEREKAAEAQFELKEKEGAIEMKYFKEFRNVLTSSQLLKLKHAEREFSRELMNRHRERKAGGTHNAKHTPTKRSTPATPSGK